MNEATARNDNAQKLIDSFWKDITVRFIYKDNIRDFLNEHFNTCFNTKSSKKEMVDKMKELLSPDTLELFSNNLTDFGLRKKDIIDFGLSKYRADKAIKTGKIRIVAEKVTTCYSEIGKKEFRLYNAIDVLDTFENTLMKTA